MEAENLSLKSRLLSLVHDYKHLRAAVLAGGCDTHYEVASTAHKRCSAERLLDDTVQEPSPDEHTSDILDHTHSSSFASYFDYTELSSLRSMDFDKYPAQSPLSSSLVMLHESPNDTDHDVFDSDGRGDCDDDCLLLLTRCTTVLLESNPCGSHPFPPLHATAPLPLPPFKSLPQSEPRHIVHHWMFDDSMNASAPVSEWERDRYNMVTDMLEEQLLSNEMRYYVETAAHARD